MTDRRTFLTLLGAVVAASGVAAGGTDEVESAAKQSMASDATTERVDPAEALLAYVEASYGDRLDGDDLDVVLADIEESLDSAAALREVGLENADEPAYEFSAYRAGGEGR